MSDREPRAGGPPEPAEPSAEPPTPAGAGVEAGAAPTSGLKNPTAAARGVGMGALILEAIVLLLAIQPIRIIAPDTPGWALGIVAGLALACMGVAGLLRRPWGWHVGTALQVAVVLTGVFQYAMFVVGGVFLLIWIYVLKIRADLAKPANFDH